ncbi:MAG: hypothetical protein EXQ69_09600 [Acidimicrobiia bacterium]|nr:hypothetical protein [Acidimicrobiia bacterium]
MRTIGCFFMFVCVFLGGCRFERGALGSYPDAGVGDAAQLLPRLDCLPDLSPPTPTPVATWPRSHPSQTLLVDLLGDIGLDAHDAIAMTAEEERCLTPSTNVWGPPNYGWQPVYGPDEEDRGPFIIDWTANTRHRTSLEALKSYG